MVKLGPALVGLEFQQSGNKLITSQGQKPTSVVKTPGHDFLENLDDGDLGTLPSVGSLTYTLTNSGQGEWQKREWQLNGVSLLSSI